MTNFQKFAGAVIALGVVAVVVVMAKGDDKPTSKADAGPAETTAANPTTAPAVAPAPKPSVAPEPGPAPAGTSIDMATAAYEAKMVTRAQQALDKGDYKLALQEISDYEKIPDRSLLTPQATIIKIAALSHVGRKTDALALAMETRDDEKFKDYHEKIEDILTDAGVRPAP